MSSLRLGNKMIMILRRLLRSLSIALNHTYVYIMYNIGPNNNRRAKYDPDFMMKDGHSVELLLASSSSRNDGTATDIDTQATTASSSSSSKQHQLVGNQLDRSQNVLRSKYTQCFAQCGRMHLPKREPIIWNWCNSVHVWMWYTIG